MSKKFLTFGILVVVLAGVFITPVSALAQSVDCSTPAGQAACTALGKVCSNDGSGNSCVDKSQADKNAQDNSSDWGWGNAIFGGLARGIAKALMALASLALIFSGMIFDWIVKISIVDLAKNIGGSTAVGDSITTAWATLRDIANICFIFVLLYAAFKTMFDANFGNFQTTVRNIIIVALLINFSLFFSKVVIDASNIVAVGFYNSITSSNATLTNSSSAFGSVDSFKGISGGYMNMLGMQTLYSSDILTNPNLKDPVQILIIGIMSAAFMLITAVILLISGVMFATRFILLIFLMILSPLALIAYIIPGQKSMYDKWQSALIDQSFFAPLFFALTWVVFKLGTSLIKIMSAPGSGLENQSQVFTDMFSKPGSTVAMLVNYVLIIGFAIAALVISKSMASRGATATAFKAISGGIGTAAIGGAALAARNTVGRASSLVSETQREKWSKSSAGRAGLWLANKGGKASYDVRGIADTKLGKRVDAGKLIDSNVVGKVGGKGGYTQAVKDKAEAKAKYAKEVYGQTGKEKEEAEKRKGYYEGYVDENGKYVKGAKGNYEDAKNTEEEKIKEDRKKERTEAEKIKNDAEKDVKDKEKAAEQAKNDRIAGIGTSADEEKAKKEFEESKTRFERAKTAHTNAIELEKKKIEDDDYSEATKVLKTEADNRKKAWEDVKNAGTERQKDYAKRLEDSKVKNFATAVGVGSLGGGVGAVTGGVIGSVLGPIGTAVGAGIGASVGAWVGAKTSRQGNRAAAREVRKQAGEKSNKDKAADLLKAIKAEEDAAAGTAAPAAPPPPPPASP